MITTRYFVEHLAANADPHHPSQKSAVHGCCRSHHWTRLDSDTIVGVAHFNNLTHLAKAKSQATMTVLPHLHDSTPVKSLLPADKFGKLQQRFGVSDSDSTSDFIGKLLAAGMSQFEPNM